VVEEKAGNIQADYLANNRWTSGRRDGRGKNLY
jgi:hypothetical protein